MKTKYCNNDCKLAGYKMHEATCIYKRRDAGEFDIKPIEISFNGNWIVDGEEINNTVPSLLIEALRIKLNEIIKKR